MSISIQSRKAKGRRWQQYVRDSFRAIGSKFGLEDEDYVSTPMGVSGVDLQLSPQAKRLLNVYVECKAVESLNVPTVFKEHYNKYKSKDGLILLCHTRNNSIPLVTLRLEDFLTLITENLELKHGHKETK